MLDTDTTANSVMTNVGRRLHMRVPFDGTVTVCARGQARQTKLVPDEVVGRLLDLSAQGARLALPGLWQEGWEVVVGLRLPERFVVMEGEIQWRAMDAVASNGAVYTQVGVKFGKMPGSFRAALVDTMSQALKASA